MAGSCLCPEWGAARAHYNSPVAVPTVQALLRLPCRGSRGRLRGPAGAGLGDDAAAAVATAEAGAVAAGAAGAAAAVVGNVIPTPNRWQPRIGQS